MKKFKVDRSPYKRLYVEMRRTGKTLKQIQGKAKDLGEELSLNALSRYFRRQLIEKDILTDILQIKIKNNLVYLLEIVDNVDFWYKVNREVILELADKVDALCAYMEKVFKRF